MREWCYKNTWTVVIFSFCFLSVESYFKNNTGMLSCFFRKKPAHTKQDSDTLLEARESSQTPGESQTPSYLVTDVKTLSCTCNLMCVDTLYVWLDVYAFANLFVFKCNQKTSIKMFLIKQFYNFQIPANSDQTSQSLQPAKRTKASAHTVPPPDESDYDTVSTDGVFYTNSFSDMKRLFSSCIV